MAFTKHVPETKTTIDRAPERVLQVDERFAVMVRGGLPQSGGSPFLQTKIRVYGPDGRAAMDLTMNQLTKLAKAVPELDNAIPDLVGIVATEAETAFSGEKPESGDAARKLAAETADMLRDRHGLSE